MAIALLGSFALLLGLLLTWLVRGVAIKLRFVDEPDGSRKLHGVPIPRVGGVAVVSSYAVSFWLLPFLHFQQKVSLYDHPKSYWVLISLAIVFSTGLIDDLATLRPLQKLAGQFVAAVLVWAGGVQVHLFHNVVVDSWLSLPLTVVWLVLCMNAFNLIDGLDGLAAGTSLISTVTILVAALLDGNMFLIVMVAPLIGALLGFLRFNFNPATIFLGDSGSLSIGFLLGCFGVMWGEKLHTLVSLLAPVMALSIPLLETGLSIARRFLRRRPIFSADRGHIHHRLLDRGKSPREVALLLYAGATMAAALALLEVAVIRELTWLVAVVFLIVAAAGVHHLGYLEFRFARRLLTRGVVFSLIDDQMNLSALRDQLQRASSTEEAHSALKRACRELGFREVQVVESASDRRSFPLQCQVVLALDGGNSLVLHGLPRTNRPLDLNRLQEVLEECFGSATWSDLPFELSHETPAIMDGVSHRSALKETSSTR